MSKHSHLYNCVRWRRLRAHYLRQSPLCERCAEAGRTAVATVLDHREPHGGDLVKFWAGPFAVLCQSCHSGSKQSEEHTGRRRGCDVNGKPFDDTHPVDAKEQRTQGVGRHFGDPRVIHQRACSGENYPSQKQGAPAHTASNTQVNCKSKRRAKGKSTWV